MDGFGESDEYDSRVRGKVRRADISKPGKIAHNIKALATP